MPFTWDVTEVKDYKTLCWIDVEPDPLGGTHVLDDERTVRLNPITEALIWKTMAVGIGQITEANAAEFYARVALIEKFDGASVYLANPDADEPGQSSHVDHFLTVEDVLAHVGLQTNATYKAEPRGKWLTRIAGQELDTAARRFTAAAEKVAAA